MNDWHKFFISFRNILAWMLGIVENLIKKCIGSSMINRYRWIFKMKNDVPINISDFTCN